MEQNDVMLLEAAREEASRCKAQKKIYFANSLGLVVTIYGALSADWGKLANFIFWVLFAMVMLHHLLLMKTTGYFYGNSDSVKSAKQHPNEFRMTVVLLLIFALTSLIIGCLTLAA